MIRVVGGDLLVVDLGGDAIYRYRLSDDGRLTLDGHVERQPGRARGTCCQPATGST